jgi:hypothetical protein
MSKLIGLASLLGLGTNSEPDEDAACSQQVRLEAWLAWNMTQCPWRCCGRSRRLACWRWGFRWLLLVAGFCSLLASDKSTAGCCSLLAAACCWLLLVAGFCCSLGSMSEDGFLASQRLAAERIFASHWAAKQLSYFAFRSSFQDLRCWLLRQNLGQSTVDAFYTFDADIFLGNNNNIVTSRTNSPRALTCPRWPTYGLLLGTTAQRFPMFVSTWSTDVSRHNLLLSNAMFLTKSSADCQGLGCSTWPQHAGFPDDDS